jgi:hypothetical protein
MKKLILALCLTLFLFPGRAQQKYDVAAYLYPAYAAGDARLRPFWPMGIGEWETVLNMQQRYPRHEWNRHPLWGYINEADPGVMEMEIDQAADHGVNVFIFDWYWLDGRPWMETTLTEGFLKARNRDRMQFYLMWANHNVDNSWDTRLSHLGESNVIYRGGVGREEFEKVCKRNIDLFFKQPNYYRIDGKPVFMIYEVTTFIDGLGGVEAARDALAWFRQEVKDAGFPDLELQFTMWDTQFKYSGLGPRDTFIRDLGFNSLSHYQFCHYLGMDDDYGNILDQAYREWDKLDAEFSIPYYPHVSIGWDNSPRFGESAVVKGNTPERFEDALRHAKAWLDARPDLHKLITVNSWNEWTETSYLQPDDVYGYGYLDAVKNVFVEKSHLPEAANKADAVAAALKDPKSEYMVVVSHRGDWRNYPENSLPAIESIIRMGVDMMELDLKKTKDGVLVLMHDGTLDRTSTGHGKVSDYTYEELLKFNLKRGHGIDIPGLKIPTLRQALEVCKDRITVNVDQGYEYYDEVLAIAEELGVTGQILIKGGYPWPEVQKKLAQHPRNLMYMPVVSNVQKGESDQFKSYITAKKPQMAYELCFNELNDEVRSAARKVLDSGSKVWVNTIWGSLCGEHDDDKAFEAADPDDIYAPILDLGTSIIQTDRPEFLIRYLEKKGRR